MDPMHDRTLQNQISELENLYAEYLGIDMNKTLLKAIHTQIKELKERLHPQARRA